MRGGEKQGELFRWKARCVGGERRGRESGVTFRGETGGWPSPKTARWEMDLQEKAERAQRTLQARREFCHRVRTGLTPR